jgi:hypothetical protein
LSALRATAFEGVRVSKQRGRFRQKRLDTCLSCSAESGPLKIRPKKAYKAEKGFGSMQPVSFTFYKSGNPPVIPQQLNNHQRPCAMTIVASQ